MCSAQASFSQQAHLQSVVTPEALCTAQGAAPGRARRCAAGRHSVRAAAGGPRLLLAAPQPVARCGAAYGVVPGSVTLLAPAPAALLGLTGAPHQGLGASTAGERKAVFAEHVTRRDAGGAGAAPAAGVGGCAGSAVPVPLWCAQRVCRAILCACFVLLMTLCPWVREHAAGQTFLELAEY